MRRGGGRSRDPAGGASRGGSGGGAPRDALVDGDVARDDVVVTVGLVALSEEERSLGHVHQAHLGVYIWVEMARCRTRIGRLDHSLGFLLVGGPTGRDERVA